jgi:hypothetical protein
MSRRSSLVSALAIALSLALLAAAGFWKLGRDVERSLATLGRDERPLEFVALAVSGEPLPHWGGEEVSAVAWSESGLVAAGASGVFARPGSLDAGLPTLRASAVATWRGRLVAALAAGGFFRRVDGRWQEGRSGFGTLHVRALLETEGGELLLGAREGLFRTAWGATRLERLEGHPVRALAAGPGFVLAGGEEGLRRLAGRSAREIPTPDPWIESVAELHGRVVAVTAAGLASGVDTLTPVPGGEATVSGVVSRDRFVALAETGDALRRFDAAGRFTEELLPASTRRLFAVGEVLVADTESGLLRRDGEGWVEALPRPPALPWPQAHVGALAWLGERLVAGRFDGGLAVATPGTAGLGWRGVRGSATWGVNALLPAGGALYVASLRGAARFDGRVIRAIEGPGAAFSLASTPEGVVIGYAQGVLLPGQKLLSAFHGLPGNQATALAGGTSLFVGTPSGLGSIRARRVAWRVTPGEGKLPHPWVTALLEGADGLYVGTYGGGVARRVESGRFAFFEETRGLKVAAGAIVEAEGRLFLGTEGQGLFRLSRDGKRFERVHAALPSSHVTALLPAPGALFVGTDEGLARLPLTGGPE